MIKVMCDKKVLLEKMREGTYDKGEVSFFEGENPEYAVSSCKGRRNECNII